MQVKTNTKERFHVITVADPALTADMAAELSDLLLAYLQNDVKNVILNLKELQSLDEIAAERLVKLQQNFYEKNSSFVICEIRKPVEDFLDNVNLLEVMNDANRKRSYGHCAMEEIEREFLNEEQSYFPNLGNSIGLLLHSLSREKRRTLLC
jgi:anti-anti-sigma factor